MLDEVESTGRAISGHGVERRRRERRRQTSHSVTTGIGILVGFALAIVLLSGFVWLRTGSALPSLLRSAFGSGPPVLVSEPTVVRQIRQLQRLETAMYSLQNVVAGERDPGLLPKFLTGDKILLMGYGEVVAGINLAHVEPSDVSVHGRSVRLTLPKAEVFSSRIDNQRTRVYSRETGLLVSVDPNLESEVRRAAESQIREAALKDGILTLAEENARTTLTSFLEGLGFSQIEVRINK